MDDLVEINLEENFDFKDVLYANNNPTYGKQINGSFGKRIGHYDIRNFKLLCLNFHKNCASLHRTIHVLTKEYELNFITGITYKIKPNTSSMYIQVTYFPEIDRFLKKIFSGGRHILLFDDIRATVTLINDFFVTYAVMDHDLKSHCNSMSNIHINFLPDNSLSPSQNLLNILGKFDNDKAMNKLVKGIFLKLDQKKGILYHFGNIIVGGLITDKMVKSFQDIIPNSNRTSTTILILPTNIIRCLPRNESNVYIVNKQSLDNNLIMNSYYNRSNNVQHATPQNLQHDVLHLFGQFLSRYSGHNSTEIYNRTSQTRRRYGSRGISKKFH